MYQDKNTDHLKHYILGFQKVINGVVKLNLSWSVMKVSELFTPK